MTNKLNTASEALDMENGNTGLCKYLKIYISVCNVDSPSCTQVCILNKTAKLRTIVQHLVVYSVEKFVQLLFCTKLHKFEYQKPYRFKIKVFHC